MVLPLRVRLAARLVELAEAVGTRREGRWTIGLALTQADLADLLGAGRQAVNAELRLLQRDGLLRIGRTNLEVLDLERLRAGCAAGLGPVHATDARAKGA